MPTTKVSEHRGKKISYIQKVWNVDYSLPRKVKKIKKSKRDWIKSLICGMWE